MKVLLFFLIITSSAAAQKTDFSGTWVFSKQESISGKLYSNGVPKQLKVTQKGNSITIERLSAGATGEDVTTTETVKMNGSPTETTTASGRLKVVTIKVMTEQKSFTEDANIFSAADSTKQDFKITDTWSLSEDGKELTMIRRNQNFTNGEIWEAKAMYIKQ